mmetsp:Transcript_24573/g.34307  ORF Transcript_24573/g.34307 Transcript_24573/m.34307 type:complete len:102 (-) Transcript_24573:799-1104(-)
MKSITTTKETPKKYTSYQGELRSPHCMSKEPEKPDKSTNFEKKGITSNDNVATESIWDEDTESFDDMDLPESLLRGIFLRALRHRLPSSNAVSKLLCQLRT